ncbi:MAG: hypothetical protein B1H08_03125 [Candidatus Omnitrophica bacterium 4484_171]|nr:MAG: hypothetical protein B1H08_03125 [Candidatus Omnitrophica bacterium 4484_171]
MRYGIFSDVHSNIEAFGAAVRWFSRKNIDRYIFLGDIIGYGANPCEAISLLKELNPIRIAGNHDWACVGKFDLNLLNSYAREAVIWTQNKLKESDRIFLKLSSLVYEDKDFVCVHGSLYEPYRFSYVLNYDSAYLSFSASDKGICFMGHSHRAGVYVLKEDKLDYMMPTEVFLEGNARYIFNAGSVGQPRDGDSRGCVCIYDSERKMVIFHRFEYNIKRAADKILNAGLPPILAQRLYLGK